MKLTTIEIFRILAILGVIYLHIDSNTLLAYKVGRVLNVFSVSFFYLVSIYFFLKKINKLNFDELNKTTVNRLLKPYIVWSLIYTSALVFIGNKVKFIPIFFYGLSAVQLYYIPTLIFIHYSILVVYKLFFIGEYKLSNICILILCCGYFFYGYQNQYYGVRNIGLLLGFIFLTLNALFLKHYHNSISKLFYLVGGVILSFAVIYLTWLDVQLIVIDFSFNYFLGGLGLFLIGIGYNMKLSNHNSVVKWASDVFKVYLCHVLFLEIFERILPGINYDLPHKILVTFFLFIVSMTFIQITKKIKIHDLLF